MYNERSIKHRRFLGMVNPTRQEIMEVLEKDRELSDDQLEAAYRRIRNFEKKHLKAYLRGQKRFSFGVDMLNMPVWYDVKQILK